MADVSDINALGQVIRRARKQQNLTQEQLAALSGVGPRFLRELEHGKETSRIGLVFAVLSTLGLSVQITGRGGDT
ncbi:anaerobic benzoate catabolism transcriptional regulator [Pseudovibrio axinellae]|uniref:Anaerobic benzoate catabolism transcriptional regulator n=1 Tax=Pseudovibrio axinellae TaxID=989403 RepID=A0A165VRK5_9HYPH|nr:helix-turn-helix domain-containing protein [Pseudovibrio axinellae]KZL15333.1 anaerobic benzoate catabolism transcriptional regulator [Pseudovibrio axinellae]SER83638.1 transcriptional regulator, y4mF family [Pseudovibrio axinellae]